MTKKSEPTTRLNFWRLQQRPEGRKRMSTEYLGKLLGVSQMTAWRYCQPLGPNHQHPQDARVRQRFETVTKGACNAANYADPVDAETGDPIPVDPQKDEVKA